MIEIGDFVFNYTNLGDINFEPGSKLRKIGRYCFYNCQIEIFDLPSEIVEICDGTFRSCKKLESFIIPKNSKLKIIGKEAFMESSIEKISIPSCLTTIKKGAFDTCLNLSKFEISEETENLAIGSEAFKHTPIEFISILAKNVKNSNYHDLENFVKSYNDIIPQRCSEKHLGLHSPKNYSIW